MASAPPPGPHGPGRPNGSAWNGAQEHPILAVFWSVPAVDDLRLIVTRSATRDQLTRRARYILHDIVPGSGAYCVGIGDAGRASGFMWHRAVPHDYECGADRADGAESYFLFYQRLSACPGFVVLAVRSIFDVAKRWEELVKAQLS
jgi:hypothetical protein